jgi:hypothetical protein
VKEESKEWMIGGGLKRKEIFVSVLMNEKAA